MEKNGITYPGGFQAAGLHCGIKDGGKKDLSLVFSQKPCIAAGTFTTNLFKSHSLLLSMKHIGNPINAVLINSGNANTCNGNENYEHTIHITEELARLLNITPENILMASTGTIGSPLPHGKIVTSLPQLVRTLDETGHSQAAQGIITTDTTTKEFNIPTGITGRKKEVMLGGMCKGAGMINPCMATMLGFISTDAAIAPEALQAALKAAVQDSFNMVTVDNDTSTNDMVICMANGFAGNKTIHCGTDEYEKFSESLKSLCTELAKMIAADGEGAGKLIEVRVKGAWSKKDAGRIAKKIAGSCLVKSAIYGCIPCCGRILASAGSAHAKIDTKKTQVSICGTPVYDGGPVKYDTANICNRLSSPETIIIDIDVKKGNSSATAWGCDLTEEYVIINKE